MTPEFPLPSGHMAKLCFQICYNFNLVLYFIVWSSVSKQDPRKECNKQAFIQAEGHSSQPSNIQPNFPWSDGETETRL